MSWRILGQSGDLVAVAEQDTAEVAVARRREPLLGDIPPDDLPELPPRSLPRLSRSLQELPDSGHIGVGVQLAAEFTDSLGGAG